MANAQITSHRNPHILDLKALTKRSERDRTKRFLVEGKRDILLALSKGYECYKSFSVDEATWLDINKKNKVIVSKSILEKITYRKDLTPVAIFRQKNHQLSSFRVEPDQPFFSLLIECVEKPGNLGAMMRTADAAGVDCIFLSDAVCDMYNPNVIRSSLGALFTRCVCIAPIDELLLWLNENSINLYSTTPYATDAYNEIEYAGRCAISVGSEAKGHSQELLNASDKKIQIPMRGFVDSLNVSVSAALVLYEVMKQRCY